MRQGSYHIASDVIGNAARGNAGAPPGAHGAAATPAVGAAADAVAGAPAGVITHTIVDAIIADHRR